MTSMIIYLSIYNTIYRLSDLAVFTIDIFGIQISILHYKQLLQMSEQAEQSKAYVPPSQQTTLIESLREQPNFIMEKYNEKLKADNEKQGIRKAGGVYIPPHKLRALQQEMLESAPSSEAHQRLMWELLRKSINGIVNKVNISNIQNVVVELFNENIMRGRGLLARAMIKAQMASPNFTHVYSALIAVLNTKVPQVGLLVAKRVLIQFRRSFERNNKLVCVATTKMIAHLVNQRVLGQYVALQILLILLTTPTEDSVEIACDFMVEVGQVLAQITPAGSTAIFERFKSLLHEAEIGQKAQYSIQNLFAIRKTGFKQHPGVIPELDLIEIDDQITHNLDLEDELSGEEASNMFKFDPKYQQTEAQWDATKQQILGEQNIARLKQPDAYQQQWDEQPVEEGIQDLTEQQLVNLRKTIYLAIQSTVNFEECAHKVIKMNIAKGYQHELIDMILECCMMERIYQSFFGLLAERFCVYDNKFKELFERAFLSHYNNIFNQEANKIRNLANLFAHLFYRKAIDWSILQPIRLTPDSTTAAARMFLKILLKGIAEHLGIENLVQEFKKEDMKEYYSGLFPLQNMNDLRFAINYYTTIGLGQLTEEMREVLGLHQEIINERKRKEEEAQIQLLIKQEEEMMKLAIEEGLIKEQQNKRKNKQKERQEREEREQREEQHRRQRHRDREPRRSRERQQRRRQKQRSQSEEKHKKHRRGHSRSEDEDQNRRNRSRRQRDRSNERQRERQHRKDRQRQVQKERQRNREREEFQLKRQREKEQEREREKQKQKQRQRERQKQRQLQREKEQKERERLKQLQKQKKEREDKDRIRNRSRQRPAQKKKRRRSSSSSSPDKKKTNKKSTKEEVLKKKNSKMQQKKKQSSSSSSSSGLDSSSSSDSESQPIKKAVKPRQKPKGQSSESQVSSSSSSSGEQYSPKRKERVASSSSS